MKPTQTKEKSTELRRQLLGWSFRIGLLLIMGAALASLWWSINRLRTQQTATADLTRQVSRLNSEIDLMQAQWSAEKQGVVNQEFNLARSQVFYDGDSIDAWKDAVQRAAVPLALDTTIQFRGSRLLPVGEEMITILEATVDLAPSPVADATRPMYQRVLYLTHQLAIATSRVDLVACSVSAPSNQVHHAQAVVELWTMEPDPPQP